jgi:hypothetical protein
LKAKTSYYCCCIELIVKRFKLKFKLKARLEAELKAKQREVSWLVVNLGLVEALDKFESYKEYNNSVD